MQEYSPCVVVGVNHTGAQFVGVTDCPNHQMLQELWHRETAESQMPVDFNN